MPAPSAGYDCPSGHHGGAIKRRSNVAGKRAQARRPNASKLRHRSPSTAAIAAVELGGAGTILAVPMLKDNEFIGSFTLYRQEVLPFTEKHIELVKNFAARCATSALGSATRPNRVKSSREC